jgi:hypothetical protein
MPHAVAWIEVGRILTEAGESLVSNRNADEIKTVLARAEASTPDEREALGRAYIAASSLQDNVTMAKIHSLKKSFRAANSIPLKEAEATCRGLLRDARSAVYDAVTALFFEDYLLYGEFTLLYQAWASVMEV